MKKLGFTAEDIIEGINFNEDEYNEAAAKSGANATFAEFIQGVMDACEECDGSLEDAIFQAEDAFEKLTNE